jgi:RNA polymerase sigma-70 factor (ECF subfamily)
MQNALTLPMPNPDTTINELEQVSAPAAFIILVQEHSRLLYRIAFAVTRNPQDAEDTVQESFLQLYRNPKWLHIDDHRAYLARIVWRLAIRKQDSRPSNQPLPADLYSQAANPEDHAMNLQRETQLHALIDQLPEKLRRPLALSAIADLKLVEIARILDLPEGTVRRRVHTARELLRSQWQTSTKSSPKGGRA